MAYFKANNQSLESCWNHEFQAGHLSRCECAERHAHRWAEPHAEQHVNQEHQAYQPQVRYTQNNQEEDIAVWWDSDVRFIVKRNNFFQSKLGFFENINA